MATNIRLRVVSVAIVFALSACGGGGGGSSPVPGSPGKTGQSSAAAMTFFVPSAASASAGERRANALPSTTQSVSINYTITANTPSCGGAWLSS